MTEIISHCNIWMTAFLQSCNDTGFLPSGEKMQCFKQQLIVKAYNMSNLSNVLEKENFQSLT